MRGLIPAHFMTRLEDTTGLRMAEMIDIFAGPSTGAILNAAMVTPQPERPDQPKYRARHLVKFYEREGINIFPRDSFREFRGMIHDFNNRTLKIGQLNNLFRHGHYNPGHLNHALKNLFGTTRLDQTLRSIVIPTYNIDRQITASDYPDDKRNATSRNRFIAEGGHAVWLKHMADAPAGTPRVLLHDAVMASCAAPTYFPCHHFPVQYPGRAGVTHHTGIDGVIFDNPCISYLGAVKEHVPPASRPIMIVLGTGHINRSIPKEDWNRFGALGVVDPANDLPLINIFFNASESALMDGFEREMEDNLFVFNKILPANESGGPSQEIDDASPENLAALARFFEEMLEDNRAKFETICHLLVNNRDRRAALQTAHKRRHSLKHYIGLLAGREAHEND